MDRIHTAPGRSPCGVGKNRIKRGWRQILSPKHQAPSKSQCPKRPWRFLADRAIVLSLEPISEERRRPERDLLAFEELRPAILGARLPLEDRASELRTRQ